MKILLTILVLIFNPIITDKGIQIGEIRTNNQIIKIIKMNLNNPAFLQMAGNAQAQAKEYISFVDTGGNPQIKLSCDGGLRIVSTYNGKKITQTLSNISQQAVSIQSDPNTEIFIYGKVTVFDTIVSRPGGTTKISELNTLYAKSLTYLDCNSNQITSLDVSENTALTTLICDDIETLLAIDGIGVNENVATSIAGAITNATSVDGTVTLRQGDEFNQTIIDAAMDKGWDVQYYQ